MGQSIIKSLYDFRQVTVPEKLLELPVSREAVVGEMTAARERFLTIEPVSDGVQEGDIVAVSIPDESGEKRLHINVGRGFCRLFPESELLGMRCGEEKTVVTGDGEIPVRVRSVKRRIVPEMADALAARLGIEGVSSVAELDRYVSGQIADRVKRNKMQVLCEYVVKSVVKNSEFAAIDTGNEEFRMIYSGMREQVAIHAANTKQSVDEALAQIMNMVGQSPERCWQALRESVVDQIKRAALGREYAERDGVSYTRQDAMDWYKTYAGQAKLDEESITDAMLDMRVMQSYMEYFHQRIAEHYDAMFHVAPIA